MSDPLQYRLNRADIVAQLSTVPAHLEVADTVDSTNDWLKRRLADLPSPTVMIAAEQTAGRGRRGRPWHSPADQGLYLSMAVQLGTPLQALGALSLVAGLAAASAIDLNGQTAIQLKWPNDLLLNGQKCGGCLVEVISDPQRSNPLHWVIIGVGINLKLADDTSIDQPGIDQPGIDQPWTDLHRAGHAVDINRLAAALIDQLIVHIAAFAEGGFATMRSRWQARDAFDGQAVVVHQGDGQTLHGQAAGVTDAGELLLIRAEGQQRISSGEVSLRKVSD